eukprot:1767453-Rhodomonas_salina.1
MGAVAARCLSYTCSLQHLRVLTNLGTTQDVHIIPRPNCIRPARPREKREDGTVVKQEGWGWLGTDPVPV